MSEKTASVCDVCGAALVPAKEGNKLNGTLPMDGTWDLNNEVCPHCHPELADTNQQSQ